LELNEEVREVLQLAAPDIEDHGIVINQELDDALPSIIGDRIAIQQVILNLLINAAHALQDVNTESRQVTVRTTHDPKCVQLTVEDGGVGLDDEQLRRIFEPFFTTRPGGIGMGLWISQSIIQSLEGQIWATRNADRGATFHVRLPIASSNVGSSKND
jgi:signal transduction histidine kinase